MPASEAELLSSFLLPPAPLHQVLTQEEFTALFPRAHQSNPQIKTLYRDFQYQRAVDIDIVKKNIEAEVARGERQRRRIALARDKQDRPALEDAAANDIAMEAELSGESTRNTIGEPHTKDTLQPAIEKACESVDTRIQTLEAELERKLAMIQGAIGELSDLRYGKFAKGPAGSDDLGQQVLENLQRLEAVCNDMDSPH